MVKHLLQEHVFTFMKVHAFFIFSCILYSIFLLFSSLTVHIILLDMILFVTLLLKTVHCCSYKLFPTGLLQGNRSIQ